MKKICLLALILLIPLLVRSQVCVNLYQGVDFGLNDVESEVSALGIDHADHIWFALKTEWGGYGVGKYDGQNWMEVNPVFLPDPRCTGIAFDPSDSVWFATQGGIGIVHRETLEGRTMTPANSKLPEAFVNAIAVDARNVKWIGFSSGSVASFDGAVFTVYKEWAGQPVNTIEIAADSSVWVGLGASPGVMRYKEGIWTPVEELQNVHAIQADQWGRVMVASGDSMIIYNGAFTNVLHAPPGTVIRDIAVNSKGVVWASCVKGLMMRTSTRFVLFSNNNSGVPARVSNPIGIDSQDQIWFAYTYLPDGVHAFCGTGYLYRPAPQVEAVISADKPSLVFCYGDSVTLSAEKDLVNYVWPDGSNTDTYRVYDSATVEVAVQKEDQCYYYDTVRVNVQKVFEEEKICAVSVDTSQRNIIIWERTPEVGTAYYRIYREKTTNEFEWIADVPVGQLSVFEDPDVDPRVQAVRYKISCVDTCWNESGRSFYHTTLHLSISKGAQQGWVNLDWNYYEGLDFPYYIIYRGPDPDNMEPYDTVSSELPPNYTDVDVFDTMYYRIGFPLPEPCDPKANFKAGVGLYHHSLSNLDDNKKLLTFYANLSSSAEICAYPNPFSNYTRIEFPNPDGREYQLRAYNLSGKLVREICGITGTEVFFKRGSLDPGYYVFELKGERPFRGKLVIR